MMKKPLKRIVVVLMAALMSMLCLAACGRNTVPEGTVVIWWGNNVAYKPPIENAAKRYKELNPDFEYKIVYQSSADYVGKYKALFTSGSATGIPDIIRIGAQDVVPLAESGRLANLSELGSDDVESEFIESAWKMSLSNGNQYALPADGNTIALMYNKDIFNMAGASVPTTWEEFLDACEKIKKAGYLPYDFPSFSDTSGATAMFTTGWLARNGASILTEDNKSSAVNSEEAVDAFEKLVSLKEEGYINGVTWQEGNFYSGKVGMLEMGSWSLNKITGPGKNFGVAPLFSLNDEIGSKAPLGLYSFAVSEVSEVKQEAYDFIEYLTTDEQFIKEFCHATSTYPTVKSMLEDDSFYDEEVYYSKEIYDIYKNALLTSVSRPATPAWSAIDTLTVNAVQKILVSGQDVRETLNELHLSITEELK